MTGTGGTPNDERRRVPLSEWTTLGLGGPADVLVEVHSVAALADVLDRADAAGRPVLVLGGGSNVVISDQGFPGTVVRVAIEGLDIRADGDSALVRAGAGVDWSWLVRSCVGQGLSGVECLSGIPGLVGGAPVQNVGAYGQEVAGSIVAVRAWDRQRHDVVELVPADCCFAYRDSLFKRVSRYVVTEVCFRLRCSGWSQPLRYAELAHRLGREPGEVAPLALTAEAVLELRRAKGMVLDGDDPDTRSAGSFFTNPVVPGRQMAVLERLAPGVPGFAAPGGTKVAAAWLVERAGFPKGYRKGAVAISTKHALALTASPGATTSELLALAREVRDGVSQSFGVVLEPEPVLVGGHL